MTTMYTPDFHQMDDIEKLVAMANDNPFVTLLTVREGMPVVSHVPVLFEMREGNLFVVGHLARANDQWQDLAAGIPVLVIVNGPHAYVSPSCYEKPLVPTWNYVVAHLSGQADVFTDYENIKTIINTLSNHFEASQAEPWVPEYADRLLDFIVGFEIEIAEIEGKFKLSQNRSETDQQNVIQFLESQGNEAVQVAELMTQMNKNG